MEKGLEVPGYEVLDRVLRPVANWFVDRQADGVNIAWTPPAATVWVRDPDHPDWVIRVDLGGPGAAITGLSLFPHLADLSDFENTTDASGDPVLAAEQWERACREAAYSVRQGIDSVLLRSVRLAGLRDGMRRALIGATRRVFPEGASDLFAAETREEASTDFGITDAQFLRIFENAAVGWADEWQGQKPTSVGGRPRQITDRQILNAAITYCEIGGRDAVKATARALDEKPKKVSRLLALARDADWLSKPGKGRAGGMILPAGWQRWNELSDKKDD